MSNINQSLLNAVATYIGGEINYIALSTAYDEPTKDTALEQEIQRLAVTPVVTNSSVEISGTFPAGTTGQTLSTTISTVTSNKVFTVNSITGLDVAGGQRIQVTLSNANGRIETNKISSISGSQITCVNEFSVNPAIGDTFELLISRLNVIYDGTSTLNSGSAAAIIPYYDIKAVNDTIPVTINLQVK